MTKEDAERSVWERWAHLAADEGCAMRVEPSLTEEYEWGWVVYLAAVRRTERKRPYLYDRYACTRDRGRTSPVGTKGLGYTLECFGLFRGPDWKGLTKEEYTAKCDRLVRFTRIAPPVRLWDDPHDTVVLTTREVASGTCPVLVVVRDDCLDRGGLHSWTFYDWRGPQEESLAIIAKSDLLALDPTLAEVTDLPVGWRASRPAPGQLWCRERS